MNLKEDPSTKKWTPNPLAAPDANPSPPPPPLKLLPTLPRTLLRNEKRASEEIGRERRRGAVG